MLPGADAGCGGTILTELIVSFKSLQSAAIHDKITEILYLYSNLEHIESFLGTLRISGSAAGPACGRRYSKRSVRLGFIHLLHSQYSAIIGT